jgi:hypothetical protein
LKEGPWRASVVRSLEFNCRLPLPRASETCFATFRSMVAAMSRGSRFHGRQVSELVESRPDVIADDWI